MINDVKALANVALLIPIAKPSRTVQNKGVEIAAVLGDDGYTRRGLNGDAAIRPRQLVSVNSTGLAGPVRTTAT
jgi:hypothetical protein